MKQFRLHTLIAVLCTAGLLFSCQKEKITLPLSANIFYSVDDKQVAFTALTINADSYSWDFGDGQTSTEKNPVHVYESGGYYAVTLNASGNGEADSETLNLAIALTPYVLLTGGPTATDGKTWKLTGAHTSDDRLANADADFTVADGVPDVLPQGVFDLFLHMGEVYEDEYTFYYDGKYGHDTKSDNAAFAGIVNQFVLDGGASIVNANGQDFGLCTAKYTPEANATFTYTEKEDFDVPSVYGPGGVLTYKGVSTLDFSGTEFVGFWDVQHKVIVQDVQDKSMRLVMFMSASPDYYPLATHALILTFEVVQ